MAKPIVFSFTSIPTHPGAVRMVESCMRWGWELDQITGEWSGDVACQLRPFAERLPRYREAGYTHALRLDAFDVIMTGPPAELAAAFGFYGNPVLLMGAECAIWPSDYKRAAEYGVRGGPWWFAHSPLAIDLEQDLPADYLNPPSDAYGHDQHWLADLLLDKRPGVAIDRQCLWLQSLGHCQPTGDFFTFENGRLKNKLTKTLPLAAHGNGGDSMDWIPAKRP